MFCYDELSWTKQNDGKLKVWYTGYKTENKKLRLSIGLVEMTTAVLE